MNASKQPGVGEEIGKWLKGRPRWLLNAVVDTWKAIKNHALWLAGLAFIVVCAAGASWLELDSDEQGASRTCNDEIEQIETDATLPAIKKDPNANAEGVTAPSSLERDAPAPTPLAADRTAAADPRLVFTFGQSRDPINHSLFFLLPDGSTPEDFVYGYTGEIGQTDGDKDEVIPTYLVTASVNGSSLGRIARLDICIDPEQGDGVDPKPGDETAEEADREIEAGTYTGAVVVGVASNNAAYTAVPMEVTVRDDRALIAMIAVLIGVIAGMVLRTALEVSQNSPKKKIGDVVFTLNWLVMLGGGLIGGALVFGPAFSDKAAADIDLYRTLLPLAAASFTATLAAKTLADLSSPNTTTADTATTGSGTGSSKRKTRGGSTKS